ncbi:MAG TPA: zinc ribbon domain-containing protein [Candidatus Ozemobacteraceae bacterium]|nr:zinc ribbon domain-containing protein [Candidatus Ozemobacteraceae bacterium]
MRQASRVLALFWLLAAGTAAGFPCNSCGTELAANSRFCNGCGAAQQAASPSPRGSSWLPVTKAAPKPAQKPGTVTNEQFLKIVAPLQAHEPALILSNLGSPQVPPLIQRTLIPGCDSIRRQLARRGLTLSRAQARILQLYSDRYSAILAWTSTLGSERELLYPRIERLTCLQVALLASPDEKGLAAVTAAEAVYAQEEQHLVERNELMKPNAGFENPGIAYQIRRQGGQADSSPVTFTLLIGTLDRKIGERMQVEGFSGEALGTLTFVDEGGGVRRYRGQLPRSALARVTGSPLTVRYVVRTTFSTSWKKEHLRLHLLPAQRPENPAGFDVEALHGTTPEITRQRFLQSIGR